MGTRDGTRQGTPSFVSSCTLKAMGVTRSGQDFGNTPATWRGLRSSSGEGQLEVRDQRRRPQPRNRRQGFRSSLHTGAEVASD